MPHLEVKNLKKQFAGNVVFKDLNVNTESSVLGIGGENGSGKTTLLKCLCGLLKPSSGTVQWNINGKSLKSDQITTEVGFLAPSVQLYGNLTCLENIRFLCELRNLNREFKDLVNLLGAFQMHQFADHAYGELSTGQQQRIKLVAATFYNPSVLILDEPGANLDSKGKELVRNLLSDYKNDDKMVIIASNQSEELELSDQIIWL